jgi:hypothetical protein
MWDLRRWLVAVALALAASAGAAFGAELLGDPASLVPSDIPHLLGPITETGRTGWDCAPERAARSKDAVAGGLPGT